MATYYVSSSYGGATSNGALATPWKSLSDVQSNMSSIQPGDQILFKRDDVFPGQLTISKSGTSTAPITFGSYGTGAKPVLSGTGSTLEKLFNIYQRSYLTFQDLSIKDNSISATDRTIQAKIRRGWVLDNSNNIKIRGCDLDRVGVGVYMTGASGGYNTIEYCDMGNMRMVVNTNDGPPPGNDDDYGANPVVISSSNNVIRNNYFHDCWAQSFDYGADGGAVELYEEGVPVSNNIIINNTFYDCNGVAELGGNGGVLDNNIFAYNKCIWNGGGFYISNSGTYQVTVTNLKLFNNVFIEHQVWRQPENNASAAYIAFKAAPTLPNTLIFKNNVVELYGYLDVFRNQWGAAGALVESNNVYKRNTQTSGSLLNITPSATSKDQPTTAYFTNTADPNPLNWNYTPLPGSILVNMGTPVGYTTDFLGNTISGNPDIGIIDYQATSPTPTPIPTPTPTARVFYVAANGNDSNNGTSESTPWASLSKVRNFLSTNGGGQPGDQVLFRKGDVWTGQLNLRTIWGGTAISGTVDKPIYIGSYGTGEKPRITGATTIASFHLAGVNYYTIDGINFEDKTFSVTDKVNAAPTKAGIQLGQYNESTANYITVKNCSFSNIGLGAIIVGDNNLFDNCSITNMKNVKNTYSATFPGNDDDFGANPFTITGSNNKVLNCWIEGGWAESIDYGWNGGAFEMFDKCDNNIFMNNTIVDCGGVAEFGAGIMGLTSSNNLFAYNKIINCGNLSYCNISGTFAIQVANVKYYNNVIIETSACRFAGPNFKSGIVTQAVLDKLTAVGPETNMLSFNGSPSATTVYDIKNNFFYIENGQSIIKNATVAGKTVTQNNVYRFISGSLGAATGTGDVITNSSIDAIIKTAVGDPKTWDYTPATSSPLVSAGQDVGLLKDFAGNTLTLPVDAGIIDTNAGIQQPVLVRNGRLWIRSKKYTSCLNTCDGAIRFGFSGTNLPWQAKINNGPWQLMEDWFFNLCRANHTITIKDSGNFEYVIKTSLASKTNTNC